MPSIARHPYDRIRQLEVGYDFTPARARGFKVLVDHGEARYSNTTNAATGDVYWQTANWLVESGLAYYPSGSSVLHLTQAGRALALRLGWVVGSGA